MMKKLFAIYLSLCAVACRESTRTVKVSDNVVAKGNMTADTLYKGEISFFDATTMQKTSDAFFTKGVLDGRQRKYFPDGKLFYTCNYDHGKRNGYAETFDSSGSLSGLDYFYYDLPMGPSISYQNAKVVRYDFYSFDNRLLFDLNYDSIGKRKITDIENHVFLYTLREKITYDNESPVGVNKVEILLFKPAPPGYRFTYDLVDLDDKFHVQAIEHHFDNPKPWEKAAFIPFDSTSNKYTALRLMVKDSINGFNHTMFKYLRSDDERE